MSTLYDTISLKQLQVNAMNLQYPLLALQFAMHVYTRPKTILAAGELSPWFRCSRVSTSTTAGKNLFAAILTPFPAKYNDLTLNGWVDDIGFDAVTRMPTYWPPEQSKPGMNCGTSCRMQD